MKFAGQLKFPDLDHPGLPVVFLVEDNHAQVLLDGESLGRWALFDVEATRLVAKAFQVQLDGEEITFIADEPIDFAYKGVEHMAQTWARAKALSLPRRTLVVRKIRRDTQPSRLTELRAAVVENLEAPMAAEPIPAARSLMSVADRIAAAREAVATAPARVDPAADLEPADIMPKARLIPGPGLVRSLGTEMAAPVTPVEEEVVEEPVAEVVEEPVAEVVEEPVAEVVAEGTADPVPVIEGWLERERAEPEAEEVLTPWFAGAEDMDDGQDAGDPIDWQYQPETRESEPAASSADAHDEEAVEIPEEVKELIGTPAGSDEGLFVDLGRYEDTVAEDQDEDEDDAPPDGGQPSIEREPVLVGTSPEKSGLFGAVRSAFVRNRAPHEHEFVDAPGGMGLTRQICADCGHISIRSDD